MWQVGGYSRAAGRPEKGRCGVGRRAASEGAVWRGQEGGQRRGGVAWTGGVLFLRPASGSPLPPPGLSRCSTHVCLCV